MILDNQNKNPKVCDWIATSIFNGSMDIVTGYFTIGALAYLSQQTNEKIINYRFVIGDIVSNNDQKIKSIDLLNETLGIDSAFELRRLAMEAVGFLKQNKVECKTLEPNFCHAKLYLTTVENIPMQATYIMGSSNLTEAGIGQIKNRNVELNVAGTGTESTYRELKEWFEDLWIKPQANYKKTIKLEDGKNKEVDFKQYLIDEISKLFKIYSPLDIYNKILFQLFSEEDSGEFKKEIGKLENTIIYKKLFTFQQLAVTNLLKMLEKYDGAILADAVGLGKTWTTLAVIKFYELKGRETILLAPKKLEQNWIQFKRKQNSIFEEDRFDYEIRFHTDFSENTLGKASFNLEYINNDRPKLIVIDESHNLRNDKSTRYQILMEEILKKAKGDIKVLLLSATPINNSFKDLRNQFALLTKGNNAGFENSLDIKSLEYTFRHLQKHFNEWSKIRIENLSDFYKKIQGNNFFTLAEHLVVARTRKHIKSHFDSDIHFPKVKKPVNIFKTPLKIGDFDDLPELMEKMTLNLSAYQPSQFTLTNEEIEARKEAKKVKGIKDAVLKDDVQREYFLVRMMKILMLKRLESSWFSFSKTIDNIYNHHDAALKKIDSYQENKKQLEIEFGDDLFNSDDEEILQQLNNNTLGKKNPVALAVIDKAGRLADFKSAIKKDKENLSLLRNNLDDFQNAFELNHLKDIKLTELLNIIAAKENNENKKIIIFTAYADTANYLFNQLKSFNHKCGVVYGDTAQLYDDTKLPIQTLLQHFAPYTKLFLEKRWSDFHSEKIKENYDLWIDYIKVNHPIQYTIINKPIDILISTDVLSEGQNLQDADMVINYDVHWNPVRVIQRFGRIDRIGSPNDTIQCINFWPAQSIDDYLNLKRRVETRMAVMQFIGSEVMEEFTEEFQELAKNPIEERQTEILLKQFEHKIEDLDTDQAIGFDDFSFDIYKQQLLETLNEKRRELDELPNGIFSGYEVLADGVHPKGIIALLGLRPKKDEKYTQHFLVYIQNDGKVYSDNTKTVLEVINSYKHQNRIVPKDIDTGNSESLMKVKNLIETWIDIQTTQYATDEEGNEKAFAGQADISVLDGLKTGSKIALNIIKDGNTAEVKYNKDNFDLIAWLVVS